MTKPDTAQGYDKVVTESCEQVLVTLLRGLGPWKDKVYLIGGLTPRYLVTTQPPDVPPHAGTGDIDIVIELAMLDQTEAYHSLEENFKNIGLERAKNKQGQKISWRWQITTGAGVRVILELLADNPGVSGGQVRELPGAGSVSALNIPHASIVFDHHAVKQVRAALLGGNGIAVENIRHADIVSFICLKAYAFDQRNERKDAHDLIYCLEHAEGGPVAAAQALRKAREGTHGAVIDAALAILENRFADDGHTYGYKKDGPVAVAKFELDENGDRDALILRQRTVSDVVATLLDAVRR